MNKVYSLKYSALTGGLIAVSELARKVTVGASRKKLIAVAITLSTVGGTGCATAAQLHIDNVWMRDYLDLGQNKGMFKPGETGLEIQLKDGSRLKLPEIPVPDFSAVSNKGSTTAIGGAYSTTAGHNKATHHATKEQSWEQTTYKAIDRLTSGDFAIWRLSKYVVENTGPGDYVDFSLNQEQALERYGVDYNGKKQIIGFRVGAGSTEVVQNKQKRNITSAYTPEMRSASMFSLNWNGKQVFNNLTTFYNETTGGDSGSGYYLYDNKQKKWVFMGTHTGIKYNGRTSWAYFNQFNQNVLKNIKNQFTESIELNNKTIHLNNDKYTLDSKEHSLPTVKNNKKDLSFTGGGTISLTTNLDLGTGGVIFDENQKYIVSGDGKTFKGAGIDIGNNTTVEWRVKGAAGDDLHKIGSGTLDVKTAQGNNLKIGNGTVLLSTSNAFNNIYMAGGKGTIKLNSENTLGNHDSGGIYFTRNGGTLDLNGYNKSFKQIAATDSGTTITNTNKDKISLLTLNNTNKYMYHGNITGNINLVHSFDNKQNDANLILDGDVNTQKVDIKNAQLTLQGHATDHATFRNGAAPKCIVPGVAVLCPTDYAKTISDLEKAANDKNETAYKSSNQVSEFSQPDWEKRTFNLQTLNLENATFTVGRNADVTADIIAKNSQIILGDKTAYIDRHSGKNITGNGFSFQQNVQKGDSSGTSSFTGSLYATDKSQVTVGSEVNVTMTGYTTLMDSSLNIKDKGHLTTQNGLFTTGDINIVSGSLTMTGTPTTPAGEKNVYSPAINLVYGGFKLTSADAVLEARDNSSVVGDISSEQAAKIILGNTENTVLDKNVSEGLATGLLNGFNTAYRGAIIADKASATMNNTWWQVTGNSTLKKLNTADGMVHFSGEGNSFHTLTVDELTANNNAFVMRTNLRQADKLIVKNKFDGKDNLLLVDFIEKNGNQNSLNLDLASAPSNTSDTVFKGQEQTMGFSDVLPVITTQTKDGQKTWTLTGYKTQANQEAARKASELMAGGYKTFLSEVNNLNKRMGDLRDTNGEAGAWARIMSGTGSASGGYSDNYTHVQIGADKKHELDGVDLFTGLTMTYTDSHASSSAFSGKTKSVGAGLYASAMFDSGAYIDLIGKYVHHANEYTAAFAGLGTKDYSSHSWYAGAEVGYRYHLTESTWIEPQAELVYGAVSGKEFNWQDRGMSVTMKDKDFNPLIGRTGVDVGKSFSGKDWKVTARAGIGYQFDLLNNGETVLRDASGEKRIKGEKDGRMLMNVGLNAEVRDNIRLGLEFEKSAFGKYNVDNSVNVNFRYSF